MIHFVIIDTIFRIWARITTPSSLICERVNLPTKSKIKHHYDIKNKELQKTEFYFACCFRCV
jgi:hypothetical protein